MQIETIEPAFCGTHHEYQRKPIEVWKRILVLRIIAKHVHPAWKRFLDDIELPVFEQVRSIHLHVFHILSEPVNRRREVQAPERMVRPMQEPLHQELRTSSS